MKLKELMTRLPDLREEGRMPIRSLLKILTPISSSGLMSFQFSWDGTKSYEEFVVAQNEVIRELVEWELSDRGRALRKRIGFAPLTEDTEIPDAPIVTAVLRKTQTDDGLVGVVDNIPLGKEFRVELSSIMTFKGVNKGVKTEKEFIREIDNGAWIPVELLFIPGYTT